MKIAERYEVLKSLGRGGWGEVFLVKDLQDDGKPPLALKLTRPNLPPGELLNFKQEFYLLSHLSHSNILKVYDFGEVIEAMTNDSSGSGQMTNSKRYYMTMEYVEGRKFNQYFAPRFAKGLGEGFYDVLLQTLSALHYIHQKGWVHSDIKPTNLLITKENQVKLLDFGLAISGLVSGFESSDRSADSADLRGTLGYIAPEILRGSRGDPRSDLYSLGVLLYETLTQRLPFDGESPLKIIRSQLEYTPPNPSQINPHIPNPLSEIVMKLMNRDPSLRYPSTEELFEDLVEKCNLGKDYSLFSNQQSAVSGQQSQLYTPPLIARDEELTRFKNILLKSKEGIGGLVLLSGERGIGKSRLLQEFKFQGQLEGFQVLTGSSSETEKSPFYPIRQIFRQLPYEGILPFDSVEATGRSPLPEEAEKWRIFDEVTRIFSIYPKPLILLLDDLHLADPLTLDLTAYLARSLCKSQGVYESKSLKSQGVHESRSPESHKVYESVNPESPDSIDSQDSRDSKTAVIIVISYESISEESLKTFLNGTRGIEEQTKYELKNLSEKETKELLNHLLAMGDPHRVKEAGEWIHQQTGGIPLLVEETTKWLVAEKILERKEKRWTFHKDLVGTGLKPAPTKAIENLVSQTLSRLDETTKYLLEEASVIGDHFSIHLLKELTELGEEELYPLLSNLERDHLLRRESGLKDQYSFTHHWLSQILYERIESDRKKEIHRKILSILEKSHLNGNTIALAHHAYLGEVYEKFCRYGMKAGEVSERSYNYKGALELYGKLLPLFEEKEEKLKLFEKMGDLNEKTGNFEESLQFYSKALEMEKRKENLGRIHLKIGTVERKRSLYPEALKAFEKGLSTLQEKKTPLVVSLLNGIGWVYREQGEYDRAIERLSQAEKMAQEIEDREGLTLSLRNLATAYWNQRNFKEAIEVGERSLAVAEENHNDYQIAAACNNLGIFHWNIGKLDEARNYYSKSLGIREKIGDRQGIGLVKINHGLLYQDEGNWEIAIQYFVDSFEIFDKLNDVINITRLHNCFGFHFFVLGNWDEAAGHYIKSLEFAKQKENKLVIAQAHYSLGCLHLYQGDLEQAKENLETGLSISEDIRDPELESISLLSLALLEKERNVWEKVVELFEKTRKNYEEKGIKKYLSLFFQIQSMIHLNRKEIEKALQFSEEAIRVAKEQKDMENTGSSHRILAMVYSEKGEYDKALENLIRSREIFENMKNPFELARTLFELARFHLSQWQKTHHTDTFRSACNDLKKAEAIFRDLDAKGELEKVHTLTSQLIDQLSVKPSPFGREDQLKTLYEASQVINSILDLRTLLRKVMDLVINLLKAERGVLLLKDNGDLRVSAGKNMDNTTIRDASELSKSILKQVAEERNPIISSDALMDPRFQERESVILNNIRSLLCVPLRTQNRVIGTIYVDSRITSHLFTEEDQDFLTSLSNLIAVAIENARYHDHLKKESQNLRREVKSLYSHKNIIGNTKKIEDLRNLIEQSASSDSTVLIMGETGTGKELVARAIHYQSQRTSKRFIPLVCGSVPESLLESELFGHKKGSFTGAISDAEGIFEAAYGGTIFLDEIGDAPLSVQIKLLRFLEEGEIRRVGDSTPRKVDVRVICATNKNLIREVEEGRFRQDLFYRINVIFISIPPLRDRKEDIPLLSQHFLNLYSSKAGKELKGFSPETMDYLLKYPWPGNVRELENYIERAVVMAKDETITPKEIYPALKLHQPKSASLSQSRMDAERTRIEEALIRTEGNISHAAVELGLHRQQLQRVMKRFHLTKEMFKHG